MLAGTILSAVISSVITVGFLSALVTRLQIRIDHRNNGIKRSMPRESTAEH